MKLRHSSWGEQEWRSLGYGYHSISSHRIEV